MESQIYLNPQVEIISTGHLEFKKSQTLKNSNVEISPHVKKIKIYVKDPPGPRKRYRKLLELECQYGVVSVYERPNAAAKIYTTIHPCTPEQMLQATKQIQEIFSNAINITVVRLGLKITQK